MNVNTKQVGGTHYKNSYQHWDLVLWFALGYFEGQITKYVTRHRRKKGREDLEKAVHFLEKLMSVRFSEVPPQATQVPYGRMEMLSGHLDAYAQANDLNPRETNIIRRLICWHILQDLELALQELRLLLEETYPEGDATGAYVGQDVPHHPV